MNTDVTEQEKQMFILFYIFSKHVHVLAIFVTKTLFWCQQLRFRQIWTLIKISAMVAVKGSIISHSKTGTAGLEKMDSSLELDEQPNKPLVQGELVFVQWK